MKQMGVGYADGIYLSLPPIFLDACILVTALDPGYTKGRHSHQ